VIMATPRKSSSKAIRQYGAPPTYGEQPAGARLYGGERKDPTEKPKDPDPSPPKDVVDKFHKHAGVDTRKEDIHHTIGPLPAQAASGSHSHNGTDGVLLLDGYTITGVKSSPSTVLPSIIAALVRLGADDSTT
jgi:hypothetical protein